ncbi:MAG: FHS family glucose/mannose:H+ symporter-like MFS transporter [Flavobacteriales bacterium]|jgi:FHS family glucose/mannose:H+ symporter-like MFS transporter
MNRKIVVILIINYAVFGVLLNSVGVVIMQSINIFLVTKESASLLEGFKDIPIAVVSFFVASSLPRIGYKKAMSIAFCLVVAGCLLMPIFANFLVTKIMFLLVGVAFALTKVSVYSVIGLISNSRKEHVSTMNFVEGGFMVGVLGGYWLFSSFIGSASSPIGSQWLNVYWVLIVLSIVCLVLTQLLDVKFDGASSNKSDVFEDFYGMCKLLIKPVVFMFVISAFLYVVIEQSIQTWLPTFNNQIFNLPGDLSVQLTSLFAVCVAAGRISAGYFGQKLHWYTLINICIIGAAAIVLVALPLAEGVNIAVDADVFSLPIAVYILPMIGLFLAPIYPILNSVVLSSLDKSMHASMTGLIVLSSALGGTSGSMITGIVFGKFSGQHAFYFSLVPMILIIIVLYFLKTFIGNKSSLQVSRDANV